MTLPIPKNRNVIFAHPNRADEALFSGAGWQPSLPLVNLQDRFLDHVARALDPADVSFEVDLGQPRTVRVIALVAHNASPSGKVRIVGASDNLFGDVKVDTGIQDIWPTVFSPGTVEWEDDSFWFGVPDAMARADYPAVYVHVFDTPVVAQHWRFEIKDEGNADGWFDIGRLVMSPGWQPDWNMSLGLTLGVEDPSRVTESLGGARFFDEKPKRRVARFALNHLTTIEAYERAFDMVQSLGKAGEVFVVLDPGDDRNLLRRAFLARLAESGTLTRPDKARYTMQFTLNEVVR
ncbi:MAG: hypothetical protein ACPG06_04170 [Alphaproteobacteria bacterium]